MERAGGVDFDTRQTVSRQQLDRLWRSKQSVCFAAVNDEPKAILLPHDGDAEHTGGSKGEGSEPNLHRLTGKASIRPRTAQQPRIIAAYEVPH